MDRDIFPDRPDTPEFWRLSKVLLANDALVTEDGKTLEQAMDGVIDPAVLAYVTKHRVAKGMSETKLGWSKEFWAMAQALWFDAFIAGVRYAEAAAAENPTTSEGAS